MGEEMTTPARWRHPTEPLQKLAAELRFDEDKLQLSEGLDVLSYTDEQYDVPARLALPADAVEREKRLAALDAALAGAREKYGTSLKFQFKVGSATVLNLDDYDREKLDDFFNEFGGDVLTLDIKIDKRELAKHWGFSASKADVKLFLYPAALVRTLSLSLEDIDHGEQALFREATGRKKLLILVPAHKIELDGKYLAVVGGEAIARWEKYATTSRPDPEEVKFVHQEASDKLRWVQLELKHLTPLHLRVGWDETEQGANNMPPKDDAVASALYGQLFACSLLYMAGHSSLGAGGGRGGAKAGATGAGAADVPLWVSTFSADKYLTKFDVGDTKKLTEALGGANAEKPWEAALAIAKLAAWCYNVVNQRGVAERLSVLQNVIASSMQGNSPSINCRELASQAASLYARAEVRYESFTQKELDKYLTQVKELEDAVELTTKGYNEQVQGLTKSLTENMLAAVAVVVGSFIAAVFKSPFETNVFLFGTLIYVAYLLIFPVGVGLVSSWQRFDDLRKSFGNRREEYARRLTEAEVNQIVGKTVTGRERWFFKWFVATILLYAVVLGAVCWSIFTVPTLIKSWGDKFEITGVSYGEPATGEVVPLIIRGENFNKEKEIVVTVDGSSFTNTDGQTLKVHGTTVLTFTPRQVELAAITDKRKRQVTVRQGQAAPKEFALPEGRPPIPQPKFESWKRVPARGGGSLVAHGSNYASISGVSSGGANWAFKASDNGQQLELNVPATLREPLEGRVFEVTLKNGEKMQATVKLNPTKSR